MELAEGETLEIQGSAPDPYVVMNHGAYYSCTCPSWTFKKGRPERKTCKHLKAVLGVEQEAARIKRSTSSRRRKIIVDDQGREYELEDDAGHTA